MEMDSEMVQAVGDCVTKTYGSNVVAEILNKGSLIDGNKDKKVLIYFPWTWVSS